MVYLLFSLMDSFHIIFICYCSAINNLILLKTILNVHKVYIFKKNKKDHGNWRFLQNSQNFESENFLTFFDIQLHFMVAYCSPISAKGWLILLWYVDSL